MTENKDYQLVPAKVDNEQAWDVRVLTGDYIETVIRYGNVAVNEEDDQITYNYDIISSPIEELEPTDPDLQEVASAILLDIIEGAIEKGEMVLTDKPDA